MEADKKMSQSDVTVYFDGLCRLCSAEIEHYKKMKGSERIRFVDIFSSGFDALAEGLDPQDIHRNLHVKDASGKLHIGVDAFIAIWSQIDSLKILSRWASRTPMRKLLRGGYFIFTKARPYLPRKKCPDDACAVKF